MKFLADFPALCVSHAFTFPSLTSTLQKPKIFKANGGKDPSVVGRFGSWAVCMLAPRAGHQTHCGARAGGYSVMSLPSIDCPAGSTALTSGLPGSGITEVEAACTFVLVSETPEVNLKSSCERWSTSKYHSLPAALRARKGKSGLFHWEAALGRRVVQNHCLMLERAQNSEGFFAGLLE